MNKKLCLFLCSVLLSSFIAGCGDDSKNSSNASPSKVTSSVKKDKEVTVTKNDLDTFIPMAKSMHLNEQDLTKVVTILKKMDLDFSRIKGMEYRSFSTKGDVEVIKLAESKKSSYQLNDWASMEIVFDGPRVKYIGITQDKISRVNTTLKLYEKGDYNLTFAQISPTDKKLEEYSNRSIDYLKTKSKLNDLKITNKTSFAYKQDSDDVYIVCTVPITYAKDKAKVTYGDSPVAKGQGKFVYSLSSGKCEEQKIVEIK